MPMDNLEVVAQWVAVNVNYRVLFYYENADDADYSYMGEITQQAKTETMVASGSYSSWNNFTSAERQAVNAWWDSNHFTYNASKAESVRVKGDGSTVLRVYFTRNEYKIALYQSRYSYYDQSTGAYTISRGPLIKTISAKYHAYILDKWPGAEIRKSDGTTSIVNGQYSSYYWHETSQYHRYYSYILKTLETMPANNEPDATMVFDGISSDPSKELYYYVETLPGETGEKTLDGRNYKLYKTVHHRFTYITKNEEFHNVDGYQQYAVDVTIDPFYSGLNRKYIYNGSTRMYSAIIDKIYYPFIHISEEHSREYGRYYKLYYPSSNFDKNWTSYQSYGFASDSYQSIGSLRVGSTYVGTTHILYYNRNNYDLVFRIGDKSETKRVPFEAMMTSYVSDGKFAEPVQNAAEHGYTLKWYTEPDPKDGVTPEFNFNQKMKAGNAVAYGLWIPPDHSVSFNLNGGTLNGQTSLPTLEGIAHGSSARQRIASAGIDLSATPTREGYAFAGWFFKDASNNLYPFLADQEINQDTVVEAEWNELSTKEETSATIRYVDEHGVELATPTNMAEGDEPLYVGDAFTATAKDVTAEHPGYYPQQTIQTITLDADPRKNVITFVYARATPWHYSVEYYASYRSYDTPEAGELAGIASDTKTFPVSSVTSADIFNQYQSVSFVRPAGCEMYRLARYEYVERDAGGTETPVATGSAGKLSIHKPTEGHTAVVKFYLEPDPSYASIPNRFVTYSGAAVPGTQTEVPGAFGVPTQLASEGVEVAQRIEYRYYNPDGSAVAGAGPVEVGTYPAHAYLVLTVRANGGTSDYLIYKDLDGSSLYIGKRSVTLTSGSATAELRSDNNLYYEGTDVPVTDNELKTSEITVSGDGFVSGQEPLQNEYLFSSEAFLSHAGSVANDFVLSVGSREVAGQSLQAIYNRNYLIQTVFGTLTVVNKGGGSQDGGDIPAGDIVLQEEIEATGEQGGLAYVLYKNYVSLPSSGKEGSDGTVGLTLRVTANPTGVDATSGENTYAASYAIPGYGTEGDARAPWADYAARITEVVLDDRIARIGNNAFAGSTHLWNVTLPSALVASGATALGTDAFRDGGVTSVGRMLESTMAVYAYDELKGLCPDSDLAAVFSGTPLLDDYLASQQSEGEPTPGENGQDEGSGSLTGTSVGDAQEVSEVADASAAPDTAEEPTAEELAAKERDDAIAAAVGANAQVVTRGALDDALWYAIVHNEDDVILRDGEGNEAGCEKGYTVAIVVRDLREGESAEDVAYAVPDYDDPHAELAPGANEPTLPPWAAFTGDGEDGLTYEDFDFRAFITRVQLDDRISKVGSYAFCDLTALEKVTLPRDIERLGTGTFAGGGAYGLAQVWPYKPADMTTEQERLYKPYTAAQLAPLCRPEGVSTTDLPDAAALELVFSGSRV